MITFSQEFYEKTAEYFMAKLLPEFTTILDRNTLQNAFKGFVNHLDPQNIERLENYVHTGKEDLLVLFVERLVDYIENNDDLAFMIAILTREKLEALTLDYLRDFRPFMVSLID